jgi:Iap family predicted aminopeptidase
VTQPARPARRARALPPQWPAVAAAIDEAGRLQADFASICDIGGRFAGTDSERAAVAWLKRRLAEDAGRPADVLPLHHDGWRRTAQRLDVLDPPLGERPCHALVWSPSTPVGGLVGEVVDLGRGTPADIDRRRDEVQGRLALVRHEYMFWPGTVHRRVKYEAARAAGATGFLIANRVPGDLVVTGSSGRHAVDDIPAAGVSLETAAALRDVAPGYPRVRLSIATEVAPSTVDCLILDLPGQRPEWVVVSAHIDGHPLAESAIDNATGLAAALAIARALRPVMGEMQRGLRICLFNLEEWGVAGSARYLDGMSAERRASVCLNVNLDSIAGHPALTALTSDFPALEPFLAPIAQALGQRLGFHGPLMPNSDHAHFARHGIPAFRLVAGFDWPESALRYVLTPADRRELVDPADLAAATRLAAAIVLVACAAPVLDLRT